jgi:hypothetical protein
LRLFSDCIFPHRGVQLCKGRYMHSKSKETVMSVANAIELVTGAVHELVGKEIGKTINGNAATRAAIGQLVASRIQSRYATIIAKVSR